jgi:hypothetical protein
VQRRFELHKLKSNPLTLLTERKGGSRAESFHVAFNKERPLILEKKQDKRVRFFKSLYKVNNQSTADRWIRLKKNPPLKFVDFVILFQFRIKLFFDVLFTFSPFFQRLIMKSLCSALLSRNTPFWCFLAKEEIDPL